jgi:hypothetical protein
MIYPGQVNSVSKRNLHEINKLIQEQIMNLYKTKAIFLILAFSLVTFLAAVNGSAAEEAKEGFSINGIVRDNQGTPLENVRVGVKDSEDYIMTDRDGRFVIPFNKPGQRFFQWEIAAGKKGYLGSSVMYMPGGGDLSIMLQAIPDFNSPGYKANKQVESFGINGFVRSKNGLPVENARVRIRGSEEFVTTDKQGRFTVPLKNSGQRLFQWIITAGREGYVNSGARYTPGQKVVVITLQAIPDYDDPNYQMVITSPAGPFPNLRGVKLEKDCGNCHTTVLWEWGVSKMGKPTQNKNVLNAYEEFIEEKGINQQNTCADCHAPIAALQAPGQTDYGRAVKENFNLSKGIECDFCHKIKDVEVSNRPGLQSIKMNRLSAGNGFFEYGPYDDTVAMPMVASYNPLYKKSEYCSSCHQDAIKQPAGFSWDYEAVYPDAARYPLYENGQVIPNQWTYQEWLEWQDSLPDTDEDKGRQCQDCHMNWTKDMLPYYRYVVSGDVKNYALERSPDTIFPHKFEGASPKRLQGSARLFVDSEVIDGVLEVNVGVTNVNAGHRLPTGEYTRNMILLVMAEDEEGNLLDFIDGSVVPDWGGSGDAEEDYGGMPGKGYARITADDNGTLNVPVWRATRIVSDNRIKAKETDESLYRFRLPSGADAEFPAYVTATLIYRKDFRERGYRYSSAGEDIVMQEKTIETGNGGL